jgi:hypothetical protein
MVIVDKGAIITGDPLELAALKAGVYLLSLSLTKCKISN